MTKKKGEDRLMQLELSQLRTDGGTQPRVAINDATVTEYAGLLKEGVKFPPVVAFHDGATYWLADGFHRFHAHKRAGLAKIEVDARQGTLREAILYSVGANAEHGLTRTDEDKRKAVETMLTHELAKLDDDGHPWSDNVIAKRCGVHQTYVGRVKASLMPSISEERPQTQTRTYITKHGTKAVMNTAKIGRSKKRRPSSPAPIAKDAFKPVQFHGENGPVPMRTISLPLKNPRQAAKGLLSVFGEEYVRKLAAELNLILQNKKGS
jgi:hypothetical protein